MQTMVSYWNAAMEQNALTYILKIDAPPPAEVAVAAEAIHLPHAPRNRMPSLVPQMDARQRRAIPQKSLMRNILLEWLLGLNPMH